MNRCKDAALLTYESDDFLQVERKIKDMSLATIESILQQIKRLYKAYLHGYRRLCLVHRLRRSTRARILVWGASCHPAELPSQLSRLLCYASYYSESWCTFFKLFCCMFTLFVFLIIVLVLYDELKLWAESFFLTGNLCFALLQYWDLRTGDRSSSTSPLLIVDKANTVVEFMIHNYCTILYSIVVCSYWQYHTTQHVGAIPQRRCIIQ